MKYSLRTASLLLLSVLAGGCLQQQEHLALGILARDRVVLTATSSELILQQPVREGSIVQKGDLLVQLDDSLQQAVVAHAEAEENDAAANFEKLTNGAREEEIAEARARVKSDEALLRQSTLSLDRSRTLQAKQSVSKAELDDAIAHEASRRAALLISREQLHLLTSGT